MEKVEKFLGRHHSLDPHLYKDPTCPDLERNYSMLFHQLNDLKSLHLTPEGLIRGRVGMLPHRRDAVIARIVNTDIEGLRGWIDDAPLTLFSPLLIKNPDFKGSVNHSYGVRNGLIMYKGFLFGCVLYDNGVFVRRPVRAPFQYQLREEYQQLVEEFHDTQLPSWPLK